MDAGRTLGRVFCRSGSAWARPSCRPGTTGARTPAAPHGWTSLPSRRSPPDAEALRRAHRGAALQALGRGAGGAMATAHTQPAPTELRRRAVHLLLGVGEPLDLLPQLQAQVHDFLIDEFALPTDPQRAPLRLCKGLARLAAPMARCVQRQPAERCDRPWPAPASKWSPTIGDELIAPCTARASSHGGAAAIAARRRAPRADRRRRPGRLRHRLGIGRTGLAQHAHRPRECAGDARLRATRPGCSTASSTRRKARMRASTAPPRCWRSARCSAPSTAAWRAAARRACCGWTRAASTCRRCATSWRHCNCRRTTSRRWMPPRPGRAAACRCSTRPGSIPAAAGFEPAALARVVPAAGWLRPRVPRRPSRAVAARRWGPLAIARRHRPGSSPRPAPSCWPMPPTRCG